MMNAVRHILRSLLVLFIMGFCLMLIGLNQLRIFFLIQPADDVKTVTFQVENGWGVHAIAQALKNEGLIRSVFWFRVFVMLDGSARDLQAGTFEIFPGMSYESLTALLVAAESDEVTITIPEGFTLKQIRAVVTNALPISETEWALETGLASPLEAYPFVVEAQKPENVDMEGYLFPDTYRFFVDANAHDVAERMLSELANRVTDLQPIFSSDGSITNTHELITLASIVEREVRSSDDMAIVAGIFLNRLEIGMPLQADSTVNYFTGKDTPSVSLADTKIDSLYNTYLYPGLPPGPISSPGEAALRAVAFPKDSDYLYFLTDTEGNVHYARTLEEHGVNRQLYLE